MSAKAEPRPCSACPTITPRIIRGLCQKCYTHLRYTENREHIIEMAERWRAEHPERYRAARVRIAMRKYYALTPEQRLERSRQRTARMSETERQKRLEYQRERYRKADKARRNAISREWKHANPDKVTAAHEARRAAKKASAGMVTADQWRAIKSAYSFKCAYCGQKSERLSQDHVIPLSKGGLHQPSNIVPACRSCNSKKHAKLLENPPPRRLML